jgi:hypothetical protein
VNTAGPCKMGSCWAISASSIGRSVAWLKHWRQMPPSHALLMHRAATWIRAHTSFPALAAASTNAHGSMSVVAIQAPSVCGTCGIWLYRSRFEHRFSAGWMCRQVGLLGSYPAPMAAMVGNREAGKSRRFGASATKWRSV